MARRVDSIPLSGLIDYFALLFQMQSFAEKVGITGRS
jgi:hypothetical protein